MFGVSGAERKREGETERAHGGAVPLHPVARHGRARVHPPRPHLHPPLVGRAHPRHGPCGGALQVAPHTWHVYKKKNRWQQVCIHTISRLKFDFFFFCICFLSAICFYLLSSAHINSLSAFLLSLSTLPRPVGVGTACLILVSCTCFSSLGGSAVHLFPLHSLASSTMLNTTQQLTHQFSSQFQPVVCVRACPACVGLTHFIVMHLYTSLSVSLSLCLVSVSLSLCLSLSLSLPPR